MSRSLTITNVLIVALAIGAAPSPASATSGAGVKAERADFIAECRNLGNSVIEFPTVQVSTNQAVRVSGVALCTNTKTNRAILYFITAALNRASYSDAASAPWMAVTILNERGEAIWSTPDNRRFLATVA